jgi:hypothetical protein
MSQHNYSLTRYFPAMVIPAAVLLLLMSQVSSAFAQLGGAASPRGAGLPDHLRQRQRAVPVRDPPGRLFPPWLQAHLQPNPATAEAAGRRRRHPRGRGDLARQLHSACHGHRRRREYHLLRDTPESGNGTWRGLGSSNKNSTYVLSERHNQFVVTDSPGATSRGCCSEIAATSSSAAPPSAPSGTSG